MNKVYKVIYSKAKACYVVASEFAKRDGKCSTDKRQSSRQTMKLAAALVAFLVSIGGGDNQFRPSRRCKSRTGSAYYGDSR